MPNNAASLSGKGSELMLPARGNPFAGQTDAATPDLSPEEVAAMFKEPASDEAAPTPVAETELIAFGMMDESPATFAMPAETAIVEISAAPPVSESPPATVTETTVVAEVSSTTTEAGDSTASTAVVAATTTTVEGDHPGVRVTAGGGMELTLSPEVGPTPLDYKRADELPSDTALVTFFVSDDRLMTLWLEIDSAEKEIITLRGLSQKVAEEIASRLTTARNLLMNHRDQFENANREVTLARYRLEQIRRSGSLQHPQPIFVYLLFLLVVLLAGFLALRPLATALQNIVETTSFELIWQTILWGGIGGLTGALYSLWRHVADKRDYDPQFALWYYTNPIMGVVLGGFVYVLMNVTVMVAKILPSAVAGEGVGTDTVTPTVISPYLLWFFAWVVGFQQNVLFRLVDRVLKQLAPSDDKSKPPEPAKSS